jgi:hypothetical protein
MTRPSRSAVVTARPDTPPPQLYCPECAYPLVYRDTVLTGVRSNRNATTASRAVDMARSSIGTVRDSCVRSSNPS